MHSLISHHLAELRTWTAHKPEAVLELMRARGAVPPNDLIDVATVGAAIAGACQNSVQLYPPNEWKGSVPKDIHHRRLQLALMPFEKRALEAGLITCPDRHHKEILDALGLGLFHLRRTKRSGAARVQL
jgi:hypothetical protein